jgi:hypothetical protein
LVVVGHVAGVMRVYPTAVGVAVVGDTVLARVARVIGGVATAVVTIAHYDGV